jgi:hypothetical protein
LRRDQPSRNDRTVRQFEDLWLRLRPRGAAGQAKKPHYASQEHLVVDNKALPATEVKIQRAVSLRQEL